MSLVELFFRFAVVAVVFAGAMVLLRRYGRSRLRQAEATHGLLVTSRLTLSRGVQLLTVKAGRRSFLVSSGGRVTVVPLEDASVPLAAAEGLALPAAETARADGTGAAAGEVPAQEVVSAGSGNWATRLGQSVGLAARRRWGKSTGAASDTHNVPDFALYLDAAEQAAQRDPEDQALESPDLRMAAGVGHQRVAGVDQAALHDARIDVDVSAVLIPALPVAPGAASAVSRAQATPDSAASLRASSRGGKPRTRKPSSPNAASSQPPAAAPDPKPRTRARAKAAQPADSMPSKTVSTPKKPTAAAPRRSRPAKPAPGPTAPKGGKDSKPRSRKGPAATTEARHLPAGDDVIPRVDIWVSELPASTPSSPVTPAASLLPSAAPSRPELPVVPLQGALQA